MPTSQAADRVAEKLGLERHDILLRVNDRFVMFPNEVAEQLGEAKSWPELRALVMRDGKVVELEPRR